MAASPLHPEEGQSCPELQKAQPLTKRCAGSGETWLTQILHPAPVRGQCLELAPGLRGASVPLTGSPPPGLEFAAQGSSAVGCVLCTTCEAGAGETEGAGKRKPGSRLSRELLTHTSIQAPWASQLEARACILQSQAVPRSHQPRVTRDIPALGGNAFVMV